MMSESSQGSRRFPVPLGRLAPIPADRGAGWATYPGLALWSLGSQVPRFYRI